MEHAEYEMMFAVEDRHWWYQGMRDITKAMLDRHVGRGRDLAILDAGCGTGSTLQYLEEYGRTVGIDLAPQALGFSRKRGHQHLCRANILELPFGDATFDLVTSFDVMSMVGADQQSIAVREFSRVLRPGGHLLLRLPAYRWLFGRHDELVHTRHRYSRSEVRRLLQQQGLAILHTSYANSFLFPLAAAKRLKDRLLPPKQAHSDASIGTGVLNGLFTGLLRAEAPLVSRTCLPFGLTIVAMAQKPKA